MWAALSRTTSRRSWPRTRTCASTTWGWWSSGPDPDFADHVGRVGGCHQRRHLRTLRPVPGAGVALDGSPELRAGRDADVLDLRRHGRLRPLLRVLAVRGPIDRRRFPPRRSDRTTP